MDMIQVVATLFCIAVPVLLVLAALDRDPGASKA